MKKDKPDIVVPQEATERGPIILGELRSKSAKFSSILVQFSKIHPKSRRAKIYVYPSIDQARRLYGMQSPFSFQGTFTAREGVQETWIASGIWLDSGSQIVHKEALYWTCCSGNIESLEITATSEDGEFRDVQPFAWFTTNRCFLLQMLANLEDDERAEAKKYAFPMRSFSLAVSDGATAEISKYMQSHRMGVTRETKKTGYSIHVKEYKDAERVKRDVEAMLILASFASRERTMFGHWSTEPTDGTLRRHWRFNIPKFPARADRVEPLVPRDHAQCAEFLVGAFRQYRTAKHTELLDSAVYALLSRDLTLEVQIMRLFSGIQGALVFALQESRGTKRPQVRALYDKFLKKYSADFSDLWPLLQASSGASLSAIRNAAVHGDAFTESDWLALSYAAENLQWILERITLVSLGWDFQVSAVSGQGLRNYYAYHWQSEQQRLKV